MLKINAITRSFRFWHAVLPLLALSGCVVGPSYKGPPATQIHDLRRAPPALAVEPRNGPARHLVDGVQRSGADAHRRARSESELGPCGCGGARGSGACRS